MATDAEYKRFFDAVRDAAMFRQTVFELVAEGCAVSFMTLLRDIHSIVSIMVGDMVPQAMEITDEMAKAPWLSKLSEAQFFAAITAEKRKNPSISPVQAVKAALEALGGASQEAK